jgi:hypothetical protein
MSGGQQKREETRQQEARTPGWAMLWRERKAAVRNCGGKSGQKLACRNIPQQLMIAHWLRNNGESHSGSHSGHFGAGELCRSQSKKIKRLDSGDGGQGGLRGWRRLVGGEGEPPEDSNPERQRPGRHGAGSAAEFVFCWAARAGPCSCCRAGPAATARYQRECLRRLPPTRERLRVGGARVGRRP